jgi:hypothetical protein
VGELKAAKIDLANTVECFQVPQGFALMIRGPDAQVQEAQPGMWVVKEYQKPSQGMGHIRELEGSWVLNVYSENR